MSDIKALTGADAQQYQVLRLRSLREHPTAFGAAYEEEAPTPIEKVAERLGSLTPENFILGAVIDGQLIGMVGFFQFARLKTNHKGMIWGMYVAPEARSKGLGRELLQEALRRVQPLPNLEEVALAVTVGNETARKLYLSVGFMPTHIEPRYIKVGSIHYDMEWMSLRLLRPES